MAANPNSLEQAISTIRRGDLPAGQRLLAEILQREPDNAQAWLWMSAVVQGAARKRVCLEKVLEIDPGHAAARQGLQKLNAEAAAGPSAPAGTAVPAAAAAPPPAAPASESPAAPPAGQQSWVSPRSVFSRLVMLDPVGLVIANPPREQLPAMQTFLGQGLMPPGLKAAAVLPLSALTQVSANRRDSGASVRYSQQNRLRLARLGFDRQADRDEFFQALVLRLGPAFQYSYQEYNRLRALLAPLVWLIILGGLTALFYGAAAEAAAGGSTAIPGRRTLLKVLAAWAITTLGPTGIAILGGVLILLVLAWGVQRVRRPPQMMVLNRLRDATLPPMLAPAPAALPASAAADSAGFAPALPDTDVRVAPAVPRRPFPWQTVGKAMMITGLVGLATCLIGYFVLSYYLFGAGRNQSGLIEGGSVLNLENQGLRQVALAEYPYAQVTLMDLSNNRLSELPPEIGLFVNLEHLYLADNQLTHLPPELWRLKKLKTLVLARNQLGELPPQVGQLANLETLDLQNNQLHNLPRELAKLMKLKHLWVQMNPLEFSALPDEVTRLPAWNR